ncbi:MAG: putative Ig domain-containing protein [Verrucomicrobia subdivision 3 bacterium]|nr:putative Ig domain-containing protein [Limisphaerales bacterium]
MGDKLTTTWAKPSRILVVALGLFALSFSFVRAAEISINSVTVTEGNAGTTNAVFTVSLSASSEQVVTVDYLTVAETAVGGIDYAIVSGTVTFPPGSLTQTLPVTVHGDLLNEADETFRIELSNPGNATLANGVGIGTIDNDDPVPALSIDDVTVIEGSGGTANAIFTLSLSAASGQMVAVNYTTAPGSASTGSDYMEASGLVSFQPDVTVQTVTLVIFGDTQDETNENFFVNISNATNATLARSQGVATINDDDPVPSLFVSDVALVEGNSGTTDAVFNVSLGSPSGKTVTVTYTTADGTAVAGSDYFAQSGTVTFQPGTTNQAITVTVNADTLNETNEVFLVNLAGPVNAILGDAQGVGTINNDDPLPVLSITDVSVLEGQSGITNAVFSLTLSSQSEQEVTVNFATASDAATSGSDFLTNSGTLTFPAGTTNRTITVVVNGDTLNEADETFAVNLLNPVNASLSMNQALGTILNDDPVPTLSINDVLVKEGNSGTTNAIFTVSLSAASGRTVAVDYATADGTANAGNDYTTASSTLDFPAGTTNRTLTIAVKGDTLIEPNETFVVALSNPAFASLAKSQGIGAIGDDETRTNSFTNAATIKIAGSGAGAPYPGTIELSGLPGAISKVAVALSGLSHTFPDDLDILLVGPAGQRAMLMSDCGGGNGVNDVNLIFDDSAASLLTDSAQINSGTFKPTDHPPSDFLAAPAPSGPYANPLSILAGANPNGMWSLYVFDDSGGDSGSISGGWRITMVTTNLICCSGGPQTDLAVTVSDSPDPALTGNNLTYNVLVINNGPENATGVVLTNILPAGANFVSATSSQGSCSRSNAIVTCSFGNLGIGASASASIIISPPVSGTITNTATVTAQQTDPLSGNNVARAVTTITPSPPTISINDVAIAELSVVSTNAVFTVSLSRSNDQTVAVNYATANGTAVSGSDYISDSGLLSFPPGTTNRTISVTVNGDTLIEPNETFRVNLSSPQNATIARGQGTGTIINDDAVLGQLDHFSWAAISPTQYVNVPFPVTVTAVDPNGNTIANFDGPVALSGLVGSGPSLSVLITEIDTDDDKVEISNVTEFAVDLSGWQITFYDWVLWPTPRLTFTVPSGTVCPAGDLFLVRDNGAFPGGYPNFYTGTNVNWLNEPTNNQVAVLLRNAAGQIIDFVCAVDGYSSDIDFPIRIPSTEWQGEPLSANVEPTFTYQRTGNIDRNTGVDWTIAANSIGTSNANLILPFAGPQAVPISPTVSGNFSSGVWTGNITVLEVVTNMYLRADDGSAHRGFSSLFTVGPTTDLALTNSGSPALASVGQNLTYTLAVTNRGPIDAAGVQVVDALPSGVNYLSATTSLGSVTQSSNIVTINIGVLTNGTRATITITVVPTAPGMITNVATVTATTLDHNSANDSGSAVVRVNFPPVISTILDQSTFEDTPTSPLSFTIDDVETSPEALNVSGTSSNTNLVANASIFFEGSGMERTFSLVPSPDKTGTTTITVFVNDGLDTRSTSFALAVNPVNDSPSFVKGADLMVPEDSGLQTVPAWATAITAGPPDESGQSLTFTVTNNNAALFSVQPAIAPNGTLTFAPSLNANGSAAITFQLRDSGGTANGGSDMSLVQMFVITVIPVNDAPGFTKGPNQIVVEDAGSIIVNGWAAALSAGPPDESGQSLSFLVSNNNNSLFLNQPAVSPAGTLTFTTATNANGTATVTVRAQDNGGIANGGSDTSAPQTFTITISPANDPPILPLIPEQTIAEGSTLIRTNTATDVDVPADTLTYTLEPGFPPGVTLNSETSVLTWTPSETQGPSTNIIAIRVSDSASPSLSDVRSFTVIVQEVNSAPMLTPIANQTVNEGSLLSLQTTASDSDIPANSLAYSLEPGAPIGATINPGTGVLSWTPSENQGPGTNTIVVRVSDNGTPGLHDTESFTVVVNEVNSAPVLTPIADQTVRETTLLSFTVTAADSDMPLQSLTFSLDPGAPPGASIHPNTGVFGWTPTDAQGPGTNSVTVRVTDNGSPNLAMTETFTIIVTDSNSPPELAAIGDKNVDEGVLLTFTVAGTDSDVPAQNLTYSLDSGAPSGASIHPDTGVFSWTPSELQAPSTNNIIIRVTDDGSPPASSAETIRIIVNKVNSAPVLVAITNRTINEGSALLITNSASDGDLPANTLTWSLDSAPAGATINPGTGVLSWTPSESQGPGTNVIVVRVSDNGTPGLHDTKSFTVLVNEVNSAPVLAAVTDRSIDEGSTLLITNSATDGDLPANTLTWSLDSAPPGATINPSTGTLSWMPSETQGPGTNVIVVRVSDGTPGLHDTKSFTVMINEVNSAPILSAVGNQAVNEGSTLLVTNSASDGDLPANTLTWSLDSAPPGVMINPSTGVLSWTPSESQGPGTNEIMVRVSDNGTPGLHDTKSFTVFVNEVNSAPVLTAIPRQTIDEERTLAFVITASDPDAPGNSLVFGLLTAPPGSSLDASSGLFTWTPGESQGPGTNLVTVQVTDSGAPGLSDTQSFTIVVNEVNRAPAVGSVTNQIVNEGSTLNLAIPASDPDFPANRLMFSLDSTVPAGVGIDPNTGIFTWTPAEDQGPGTNVITVRVTDDGVSSFSDSRSFIVVVKEVNAPPMIAPIPDRTINEGELLTFPIEAVDQDIPGNALAYRLLSAPDGAFVHPGLGTFTWMPGESQGPSTNVIVLRVSDDGSPPLDDTRTFTLKVLELNSAPVLQPIADRLVSKGTTVVITNQAHDPDIPANTLTYSLAPGAPAGTAVSPVTGVFTWDTTSAASPGANQIVVRVADNGVPSLSGEQSFTVTVLPGPPVLAITRSDGDVTISWHSDFNAFELEYNDNLSPSGLWKPVTNQVVQIGEYYTIVEGASGGTRFYRLRQQE